MDLRLGPSLKFEILSQGAEKATSCVGPPLKPGWGLQVCALPSSAWQAGSMLARGPA